MNTWVRRSLKAGALTAGAVMATGTAAYADTTMLSTGNSGILNGTQVFAPIQAPINICGVAAGVGGDAFAGCKGGSAASTDGLYDVKMLSAGNSGILNGTQVFAPIQAPINICGVAVGVLGDASAWCEGGASAKHSDHSKCKPNKCRHKGNRPYSNSTEARSTEAAGPAAEVLSGAPLVGELAGGGLPLVGNLPLVGQLTDGGLPLVGQLTGGGLPVVGQLTGGGLPVVGGLLGGQGDGIDIDALDAVGTMSPERVTESDDGGGSNGDSSDGGQGGGRGTSPKPRPRPHHPSKPCPEGKKVTMISSNNHGILNGTQIYAPIQVPVNVSGIAVGVLGDASAWSVGGASAKQ